jgi:hypothetical protein
MNKIVKRIELFEAEQEKLWIVKWELLYEAMSETNGDSLVIILSWVEGIKI